MSRSNVTPFPRTRGLRVQLAAAPPVPVTVWRAGMAVLWDDLPGTIIGLAQGRALCRVEGPYGVFESWARLDELREMPGDYRPCDTQAPEDAA